MTSLHSLKGALLALLLSPLLATAEGRYDILDLEAEPSDIAARSLIYTVARYFGRYYATGERGHILYSDDGGDSWTQARVPVRSNITDIHFPTEKLGWAVGHEGVILHSEDGGETWVKQYDGLRYGTEGLAYYQKMLEQDPDNEDLAYLVEEMEFAISQGADKPFFRVFFASPTTGYAMGAYGMSLVTRDGGENWEHNGHVLENENFNHIFDFAPLPEPGKYFISGEAGLFMVGDTKERKGTRVHSVPWEGSFFASAAAPDGAIVLGGLRGRMFRTTDVGDTWTVVEKPPTSSIVDGTSLEDGRMVFVGMAGEVLLSSDNGLSFKFAPGSGGGRINSVVEGPDGTIIVGGPKGIRKISLTP